MCKTNLVKKRPIWEIESHFSPKRNHMKTAIYPIVFTMLLFFSCGTSKDDVEGFIPGVYARVFKDSLNETTNTVGNDTLEIKKSTTGNSDFYEIHRKMKYQRTVDGQQKQEEYKTETWKGIYDKDKKVVQETTKGKLISFLPDKNILLVNSVEYKKIN
jgi:hypothetical protein